MDENFDEFENLETPEELSEDYGSSQGSSNFKPTSFNRQPMSNIRTKIDENPNKVTPGKGNSKDNKTGNIKDNIKNASSNANDKVAKAEKAASNLTKGASKVADGASKVAKASAKGIEAGSSAAGAALSAIPGVGAPLGAAVKGAGAATAKAADAVGTGLEGVSKANKKASEALDKSSKKHAAKAAAGKKAADNTKKGNKVVEAAKKTVDNAKKVIDAFKNPVKRAIIIAVICLLLIIILVAAILEPLSSAMNKVKNGADAAEKLNNFIHGLGFENSKDAFYEELDFLNTHYDGKLNESLLMATLFYDDVFGTGNVEDSEYGVTGADSDGLATTMMAVIDYAAKEAFTEEDANGIVYSANKIFRLKKLTSNMVDKSGDYLVTVPLSKYIYISSDQIITTGKSFNKSFVSAMCAQLLLGIDLSESLGTTLFGAVMNPAYNHTMTYLTENGYASTHSGFDAITNAQTDFDMYFDEIVSTFTDIKGIGITITIYGRTYEFGFGETNGEENSDNVSSLKTLEAIGADPGSINVDITITYSQYEADEEAYFKYLKNEYIPKMPEFKDIVYDKNGNLIDSKVNGIIDDIKMLSSTWEDIYGDDDGTAEDNNLCIGDINTEILDKLSPPVQIEAGTPITFTTKTAFGTTSFGKIHNGVDINEESAGVGVGTAVSSVYAGTVVASTASNDFSNDEKSGDGGWVKIEHTIPYTGDEGENLEAHVYTIYGGLDPTSVPTTGTAVSAGQQIGVIGDAIYSEDGVTPGLHFGFYDIATIKFLNPLNVFIYCSEINGQNTGYGDMTINSSSCLKVHQISISLENFKKSVNAYIQRNSNTSAASYLSTWDLDEVYNEAVRNNINPELLVVRAIKEGFSPYNKDRSNYNYWGLGCYNGSGRCEHYSSMASGIAGFASDRSVRSAESLEDMMSTYAYIGNNWYTRTQGADNYWSDGGCPYFPYIRKYMPSGRAEEVGRYCESPLYVCVNDSTPTCFPTIDVDQTAYTMYNIQGMNDDYVEIFGAYHEGRDEDCSNQVSAAEDNSGSNYIVDNENIITPGAFPNGSQLLDEPLSDFLIRQGSSIDKMNFEISKAKNQVGGNCTRNGSIAVATKTLNIMASYGTKLQYYWGGGHSGTSEEMKGVKANWGSNECSTYANGNHYNHCGLDCSGFVRWVLNTAGYNVRVFCVGHDSNCSDLYNDQARVDSLFPGAELVSTLSSADKLKPGDVMFSGYHVIYVVGVDNNGYTAAEASGFRSGILYKHYSFTPDGYHGIRMYGFYTNPANCAN